MVIYFIVVCCAEKVEARLIAPLLALEQENEGLIMEILKMK